MYYKLHRDDLKSKKVIQKIKPLGKNDRTWHSVMPCSPLNFANNSPSANNYVNSHTTRDIQRFVCLDLREQIEPRQV